MKMEVLSVQNQFQGQFGVIGSSKGKDWTSPLTHPPSARNLSSNSDDISTISSTRNSRMSAASVAVNTKSSRSPALSPATLHTSILGQDDASLNALSLRLESELRAAKSRHLACTEVLLPADLLQRVAAEMIQVSENEPCGIRGCSVYIEFEDEPSNTRRIASLKVDPNTVSTFELYLTLKHDRGSWSWSLLPQFLKNLARSSTIMISPEFTLTKNKLYHSFSE